MYVTMYAFDCSKAYIHTCVANNSRAYAPEKSNQGGRKCILPKSLPM